jgi:hypothetical protein
LIYSTRGVILVLESKGDDMGLLTRKQIIEEWKKQTPDLLNSFCCPDCRDILIRENDENIPHGASLRCFNDMCENISTYAITGELWEE